MWNLVCTCTVITAARLVEPERIRNMVAPPKPATASTRPPIGYDAETGSPLPGPSVYMRALAMRMYSMRILLNGLVFSA